VAALVVSLATGCAGQLASAKSTAIALAEEVKKAEIELSTHCGDIELDIIHNTEPGPDRDTRMALINSKCVAAYDAFNRWDEHYRALLDAVAAAEADKSKLQPVLTLLVEVVRDERAFIDAVEEVIGAFGGNGVQN
jgi:hypothetical protein